MNKGGNPLLFPARQHRDSLFWLGLAAFFGGVPLALYALIPNAPHISLVGAVVLGLPPFIYSLVLVTQYKAFVLQPSSRRLQFVEGRLEKRKVQEHSYDEIARVQIATSRGDSDPFLVVALKNGKTYRLGMSNARRARAAAVSLARGLGVQALENGKKLEAPTLL